MKSTRRLFCLKGPPDAVKSVLGCLQFKGLIANPYGTPVEPARLETIFKQNKSIVCSETDLTDFTSEKMLLINIASNSSMTMQNAIQTIYLDSDISPELQFANIAAEFNCDIGDHKSNSSGVNGPPTQKNCAYCKYLDGHLGKNERTIYQSENFFVFPTLGQFICGYLLIIPFRHITSIAELPRDSHLLEEFQTVVEDIDYILRLTYPNAKNILVWENGSGNGLGKAKDSVVHAHVHLAPSSLTSETIKQMSGFSFKQINLSDLPNYKESSYLLVKTTDPNIWEINNDSSLYIPRQLVRQYVAEENGIYDESWNWRTHPFSENMHQTIADIFWTLATHWNKLPERIKNRTIDFMKNFTG